MYRHRMPPARTPPPSRAELVGRSSSHFTRLVRMFALELGVAHTFRPVLDLQSLDPATYGGNPALKMPVLATAEGALFGAENICRALVRMAQRAGHAGQVILRGAVDARAVANAEELVLHVMASDVTLVMATAAADGREPAPKVRASLENALRYLDEHVDEVRAALPKERTLSFVEVALFAAVTHLPFREVLDVSPYPGLGAFCRAFGERASARATEYRFDAR